jgi:predicted lipoprotein with Yx(FWY)xxD motif
MKGLLIITAVVASTVTLAACGSGGGSSGSSGASPASPSAKTVSVKSIGNEGSVLVDSKGMALYASDQEMHGKVLCTGACTSFWKPLTVSSGMPSGGSLTGKLGVVKRPDGTEQVTYNGKLLYTFTQDKSGKVTGDGFSDAFGGRHFTWHVVHSGKSTSNGTAANSGSGAPGY